MKIRDKRQYFQISTIILVFVSVFIAIYNNKTTVIKLFNNSTGLQIIVNIVAIVSGASGVIIGLSGFKISSLDAVKEYFQQGDAERFIKARHNIYSVSEEGKSIEFENKDASIICSFFHFWGLMVRKKYLPIWVFESASGIAIIRLYDILKDFIDEHRISNPFYAEHFEWLVCSVKRKYRKRIKQFYDNLNENHPINGNDNQITNETEL